MSSWWASRRVGLLLRVLAPLALAAKCSPINRVCRFGGGQKSRRALLLLLAAHAVAVAVALVAVEDAVMDAVAVAVVVVVDAVAERVPASMVVAGGVLVAVMVVSNSRPKLLVPFMIRTELTHFQLRCFAFRSLSPPTCRPR